jgi:transposase-like protein
MGRTHRHYSTEFRAEAVRLAETSGQSIRSVALDLGIANQTLGEWTAGAAASAISVRSDLKSAIVPPRLSRTDEASLSTKPGQLP